MKVRGVFPVPIVAPGWHQRKSDQHRQLDGDLFHSGFRLTAASLDYVVPIPTLLIGRV
jgi:hypothetical protein